MSDHDLAMWALALNIVGLIISFFAFAVTYGQYRRATSQLLKLRYIEICTQYNTSVAGPNRVGDHVLTIDLISYGATIRDLEVKFEFLIPASFDQRGGQLTPLRRVYFELEPKGRANPLEAGQAAKFEFRRPENHVVQSHEPDIFLSRLPPRLVSVVAYSGPSRKLVARFKSQHVRTKIYNYFGVYRPDLQSKSERIEACIFQFTFLSKSGAQFRYQIERLVPGLYDLTKSRLSRILFRREPMERD